MYHIYIYIYILIDWVIALVQVSQPRRRWRVMKVAIHCPNGYILVRRPLGPPLRLN